MPRANVWQTENRPNVEIPDRCLLPEQQMRRQIIINVALFNKSLINQLVTCLARRLLLPVQANAGLPPGVNNENQISTTEHE